MNRSSGFSGHALAAAPRWHWGDPIAPLRALLARGGVVAIPTESSYGLAADPWSEAGVEAIYAVKERERGKALPVVAADLGQLAALGVDLADPALAAAARLWPAALTVVAPLVGTSTGRDPCAGSSAGDRLALPAAAGGGTLGVRIPDHPGLRGLLHDLGIPLTATSANRSGEPPLLDPAGAAALLAGRDAAVVDDGVLSGGAASTVVVWGPAGLAVLRPGRFDPRRLAALLAAAGPSGG